MTLKEKITDKVQDLPLEASPTQKDIDNYYLTINNLVKIADEYAIGFAMHISTHCYCELGNDSRSYEELLEIYKKEKGL